MNFRYSIRLHVLWICCVFNIFLPIDGNVFPDLCILSNPYDNNMKTSLSAHVSQRQILFLFCYNDMPIVVRFKLCISSRAFLLYCILVGTSVKITPWLLRVPKLTTCFTCHSIGFRNKKPAQRICAPSVLLWL